MPFKDPEIRKLKQKEYSKKHHENNLDTVRAKSAARKRKIRADFAAFKATLACTKCGENHPATLDFHHHTPNPANKKINELIRLGSFTRAMQEIKDKCIVLCSNCHRKHHWEENKKGQIR